MPGLSSGRRDSVRLCVCRCVYVCAGVCVCVCVCVCVLKSTRKTRVCVSTRWCVRSLRAFLPLFGLTLCAEVNGCIGRRPGSGVYEPRVAAAPQVVQHYSADDVGQCMGLMTAPRATCQAAPVCMCVWIKGTNRARSHAHVLMLLNCRLHFE